MSNELEFFVRNVALFHAAIAGMDKDQELRVWREFGAEAKKIMDGIDHPPDLGVSVSDGLSTGDVTG